MAKRAAARAVTPEVIDVPVQDPEVALATTEAQSITQFCIGLVPFFTTAKELETRAKQDLAAARTWTKPTSKDEDAVLVAHIRQNTADIKAIEEHWTVTALVHRFQRRLVAHRDRAIGVREDVKSIGNTLHNQWEVEEQRRTALENERLRRAEEQRQQEQRDRELADLENQALAAEASSGDLSDREERFVDYYTGPYKDAARAAQQAGYRNADKAVLTLLSTPKIIAAIEAKRTAIAIRDQAAAVKQAPLPRGSFSQAKEQIAAKGVTTQSAEVVDEAAFMAAVLDPATRMRLNIPSTVATYKPVALNECARAIGEKIELWPGIRLKKNTGVR